MSDPAVTCETCGRKQPCYQPGMLPETARKRLKRDCRVEGKPCVLTYRAGIALGGPMVGQ